MGEQAKSEHRGTVVVLYFVPSTFMMCEASPWPTDAIDRLIHAKFACFLHRGLVPDQKGKPTPGIMLTGLGDLSLCVGSWAGFRLPEADEMRLFVQHCKQQIEARSGLVLPGEGVHGLPGGVH